jgi:hypothetical protein
VAALAAMVGCRVDPGGGPEAALAESIVELGDAISTLREENAILQEQIDSLRTAVARQDSLLRTLAGMAGVQAP